MKGLLRERAESGLIRVEIKPSSKETRIISYSREGDFFRISVKSPPAKGKANQELVRLVSKILGKRVMIRSGHTSKKKVLEVI